VSQEKAQEPPDRKAMCRLLKAGPFYTGIDDDFCAVCHAYFLIGEKHRDDCAYVLLCRQLGVKPDRDDDYW
jgi:hypothetical protein